MQRSAREQRLAADLRGEGKLLWTALDVPGHVELCDGAGVGAALVWQNGGSDWRVTRIDAGDPNHDGRIELLLLLWRPDTAGALRSHLCLVGWRGGRYGVIWGGGLAPVTIRGATIGDLDGDGRQELVVLEGGNASGGQADVVSIWRWFGWGFQHEWRQAVRGATGLWLVNLSGDARPELVVRLGSNVSAPDSLKENLRHTRNEPNVHRGFYATGIDMSAYRDVLRMADGPLDQRRQSGPQGRGVT